MAQRVTHCSLCKKPGDRRCSGCQAVYYCTEEHQVAHWKEHSKSCRPCKLVESAELGKHYIAKRDIQVGERVVWDDSPLLKVPNYMKTYTEGGVHRLRLASTPVCLACYMPLTSPTSRPCDNCGWPLCRKCKRHDFECAFTKKYRRSKVKITDFDRPHQAYAIVGVARALIRKEHDPESYEKLMNLQGIPTAAADSHTMNVIAETARYAQTFFKIEDIDEAEICKILGIIMVNSFMMEHGSQTYCAVYDRCSYIEHSCRPNCSRTVTDVKSALIYNAAVPISKGEHISTNYVIPFWGTKQRKVHLLLTKFFECNCERCKDPTEFGTMFNAVKCYFKDCHGHAFPNSFLMKENDKNNFVDYFCRNCKRTMPRQWSDELEQEIANDREAVKTQNTRECLTFLNKWAPRLHVNNSYIVDIEWFEFRRMVDKFDNLEKEPADYLESVEKLCTKFNALFRIIAPAETKARATVLYLKFHAVRTANRLKSLTFEETIRSVDECQKDLTEVVRLLEHEPTDSVETFTTITVCIFIETFNEFKKLASRLPPVKLRDIWFSPN